MTLPATIVAGYVFRGAFQRLCAPSCNAARKPIHELGSPVRVKASLICLLLLATTAVHSSETPSQPVTTTELAAWLIGGVSSARLTRLVRERGLATLPTQRELRDLESAGAGKDLIAIASSGNVLSARIGPPIPTVLLKAADDVRAQHLHEAEVELQGLSSADDDSSALHFALGVILRGQDKFDDAYDEFTAALKLMPDLPENHCAMSYLFYRLEDGPNAIAEARTALSLDPKNAAAYQYLGLGHYSVGQYQAAVHAYGESLEFDPGNADSYYDMGIALHAGGNLPGAIKAYERAIDLRPTFWEAHSNLGLIRATTTRRL